MAGAKDEAQRLIAASGRSQGEIAADLSARLGRDIRNHTVSRIASGGREPKADELDALRALYGREGATISAPPATVARLTGSAETVPLYVVKGGVGGSLRLSEEHMVGVAPIHPSQRGSIEPFAFIMPDDRLADRIQRGDIAYVQRNRPPVNEGEFCLVEFNDGRFEPWCFGHVDEQTLFVSASKGKMKKTIALRDVVVIHRISGVTFGPA